MQRLFIAINLPEDLKNIFASWQKKEEKRLKFVRFSSQDNWHITLVFLGSQPGEKIPDIREAMLAVSKKTNPAPIEFKKISYGPSKSRAKMIWAFGSEQTSKKLFRIKRLLETELENRGVEFEKDSRFFNTHITLGRFDSRRFSSNLPEAEKEIRGSFLADRIDLMQSSLERQGAKYSLVFSVKI